MHKLEKIYKKTLQPNILNYITVTGIVCWLIWHDYLYDTHRFGTFLSYLVGIILVINTLFWPYVRDRLSRTAIGHFLGYNSVRSHLSEFLFRNNNRQAAIDASQANIFGYVKRFRPILESNSLIMIFSKIWIAIRMIVIFPVAHILGFMTSFIIILFL